MANPIIKNNSIIGVEEESTEGTFVAPTGVNSFVQPLSDGFDINMAREQIDRTILTSTPGKPTPRMGQRSVTANLPVEYRASGVEGTVPDFDSLLKAALGAVRSTATQTTTKATGNTSTNLEIEDADIGDFAVGDSVVVLESGAHEVRPISAVDATGGAAAITLAFALTNGAPSASVVISKFSTYYTAASGHPTLSLAYYWANEIRQAANGCRVNSMSLDNYSPGQIASLNFGLEGLDYEDELNGVAPFTPAYDSGLPPILLSACIYRNGTSLDVNTLGLSLANTLGFATSLCSVNGRQSSRIVSREITGNINPYKDDTTTTFFTDWDAGTEFSLFMQAYTPSGTTGEMTMGTVCAIWLPQCITTELQTQDLEGLLVDQMSFKATRGSAGTSEEMYMSLI